MFFFSSLIALFPLAFGADIKPAVKYDCFIALSGSPVQLSLAVNQSNWQGIGQFINSGLLAGSAFSCPPGYGLNKVSLVDSNGNPLKSPTAANYPDMSKVFFTFAYDCCNFGLGQSQPASFEGQGAGNVRDLIESSSVSCSDSYMTGLQISQGTDGTTAKFDATCASFDGQAKWSYCYNRLSDYVDYNPFKIQGSSSQDSWSFAYLSQFTIGCEDGELMREFNGVPALAGNGNQVTEGAALSVMCCSEVSAISANQKPNQLSNTGNYSFYTFGMLVDPETNSNVTDTNNDEHTQMNITRQMAAEEQQCINIQGPQFTGLKLTDIGAFNDQKIVCGDGYGLNAFSLKLEESDNDLVVAFQQLTSTAGYPGLIAQYGSRSLKGSFVYTCCQTVSAEGFSVDSFNPDSNAVSSSTFSSQSGLLSVPMSFNKCPSGSAILGLELRNAGHALGFLRECTPPGSIDSNKCNQRRYALLPTDRGNSFHSGTSFLVLTRNSLQCGPGEVITALNFETDGSMTINCCVTTYLSSISKLQAAHSPSHTFTLLYGSSFNGPYWFNIYNETTSDLGQIQSVQTHSEQIDYPLSGWN